MRVLPWQNARCVQMVFEALNPAVAVSLFAAILLLIINVFYKFLVNQEKAAELKERAKTLGEESRKVMKENPQKAQEFTTEMFRVQKEMMRMNMKPMIFSLVVVGILFSFLAGEFHDVLVPSESGEISLNGNVVAFSVAGGRISLGGRECTIPCTFLAGGKLWRFELAGEKIKAGLVAAVLPFSLPLIGSELNWIIWYIIASIPLAIIIRAAYGIRM